MKDSSLTGRDVRNESLTGKDVKSLTLGDFSVPLPAGPRGDTGPQGEAGPKGDAGPGAVDLFMDRAAEDNSFVRDLVKVGPWMVQTICYDAGTQTLLEYRVKGPAGSYQYMQMKLTLDAGTPEITTSGGGITENFTTGVLAAVADDSSFQRLVGTVHLHANSGEAVMLEVNGLADARTVSAPRCSSSGIGIPAP